MIIIAESGATKTDWCLIDNGRNILKKNTEGIHPFFSEEQKAVDLLKANFDEYAAKECRQVHFYGPGTSQTPAAQKVAGWLKQFFTLAAVEVSTDLLAAGRGAFGYESGMVCIMGTGSNSGLYMNSEIVQTIPSLGYIFGDEGSGAHIGKQLLYDYLNDRCPDIVAGLFNDECRAGGKSLYNSLP